jgi:predicted nucleotidyltransferase
MIDFAALLRVLVKGDVQFLIVGGAAATAHGSARLTRDLDVVYQRSDENLGRIVAALTPHRPYLRGAPAGLPSVLDLDTLRRGLNFPLTSDLGDIDLLGEIVGRGGYEALSASTIEVELFGLRCRCLGLEKLIEVKLAAGRPKDLEAIAELVAIRDAQKP